MKDGILDSLVVLAKNSFGTVGWLKAGMTEDIFCLYSLLLMSDVDC